MNKVSRTTQAENHEQIEEEMESNSIQLLCPSCGSDDLEGVFITNIKVELFCNSCLSSMTATIKRIG